VAWSVCLQVLGVLGLVSSAIITFGLALVVQVSPWYDPQASQQPNLFPAAAPAVLVCLPSCSY
jgi:hypothetical protein